MSEVKHTHSVSQIAVPVNRTEIIRDLCRQAHREAAIDTDLGLKPLGYFAAKALCEKVWDIAAQQSTDSHEELVEALRVAHGFVLLVADLTAGELEEIPALAKFPRHKIEQALEKAGRP